MVQYGLIAATLAVLALFVAAYLIMRARKRQRRKRYVTGRRAADAVAWQKVRTPPVRLPITHLSSLL